MSCFRLRSYDGAAPPGGYVFTENALGRRRDFRAPLIEAVARELSYYRKTNGIGRADVKECLADVDHFTCQRLGNNPTYCVPCNGLEAVALSPTNPMAQAPCASCGAPVGK
jgi:hypothetical protein